MAAEILSVLSRADAIKQGAKRYFTGMPCKMGHIAERTTLSANCTACLGERAARPEIRALARERAKVAAEVESPSAKAARLAKKREHHFANRDAILAKMKVRNKTYYEKNREKVLAQALAYQASNADKRTPYKREWAKGKAKADPVFAAKLQMRKMLSRMYEAAQQSRERTSRTEAQLGYTAQEFKDHIERQFQKGMSWSNHGEWHIDHIRPLACFDILTPEGRMQANALPNLRPIWAKENMSKSDKRMTLL